MLYCAFHKHANSKVQKPPWQLRFSRLSIIITITSNEPWNTQTHKMDRNPPITNHKPWPFEPVKVKFCFLRGPLRWLTAAKNAIVSWLLNFTIRMFLKSTVTCLANFSEQIRKLHSPFFLSHQLSRSKSWLTILRNTGCFLFFYQTIKTCQEMLFDWLIIQSLVWVTRQEFIVYSQRH